MVPRSFLTDSMQINGLTVLVNYMTSRVVHTYVGAVSIYARPLQVLRRTYILLT